MKALTNPPNKRNTCIVIITKKWYCIKQLKNKPVWFLNIKKRAWVTKNFKIVVILLNLLIKKCLIPTTRSRTVTLLRLHPSHFPRLGAN